MEGNSVIKFSLTAVVIIILIASLMLPVLSDVTSEWVQAVV